MIQNRQRPQRLQTCTYIFERKSRSQKEKNAMFAPGMALDIWQFGDLDSSPRKKYAAICDICRYHRCELKVTGRTIFARDCNKAQYRCESSFRVICANLDCLAKSGQGGSPRFICLGCNEAVYHEPIAEKKKEEAEFGGDDDYSDDGNNNKNYDCTNMLELHAIICDGRPKWKPDILELQGDWQSPEGSVTIVGYKVQGMDEDMMIEEIRDGKFILKNGDFKLNYNESKCVYDNEGCSYELAWEGKEGIERWTKRVEHGDRIGAQYPGGRPRVTKAHKLRKRIGYEVKKETQAKIKAVNAKFGKKGGDDDDESSVSD